MADKDYDDFLKNAYSEYEMFLSDAEKEYIEWLSKPWEEIRPNIIEKIKDYTTPPKPIVLPNRERRENESVVIDKDKILRLDIKPIAKPKPIEIDVPKISNQNRKNKEEKIEFEYLGKKHFVTFASKNKFKLLNTSEKYVSEVWKNMSLTLPNDIIVECLNIRSNYNLCDWAYICMLDRLAKSIYNTPNEATLLMSYLYCKSGYKMRIARDSNAQLHMLYASHHKIYNTIYYNLDDKYYLWDEYKGNIFISHANFVGEQPLSLIIEDLPVIGKSISQSRRRTSKQYSDMDFNIETNEYLIEFFNSYPSSEIDNNPMTRWAMLANASISDEIKNIIYPLINSRIIGLSERDKVNKILNWVQTSLIYEYDDKVWGYDRAFFPDETLYYPYADCEDRAILFTRFIKDLLGLETALIFVPGHLLAAVKFSNNENGDCIYINHDKFIICEPTFVNGGPVGIKGNYDLTQAKVIVLN